jgi:hypothetical protein
MCISCSRSFDLSAYPGSASSPRASRRTAAPCRELASAYISSWLIRETWISRETVFASIHVVFAEDGFLTTRGKNGPADADSVEHYDAPLVCIFLRITLVTSHHLSRIRAPGGRRLSAPGSGWQESELQRLERNGLVVSLRKLLQSDMFHPRRLRTGLSRCYR